MKTGAGMTIQKNKAVTIRYTLTDEAGGIIESSEGQEPKTLNFDVTVVDVRDATNDELDHGHAHGAGGTH